MPLVEILILGGQTRVCLQLLVPHGTMILLDWGYVIISYGYTQIANYKAYMHIATYTNRMRI